MNPIKIVMTESIYNEGLSCIDGCAKIGIEDGYSSLGLIHSNGIYEITSLIHAGPKSERSEVSFSPDSETIKNWLCAELEKNPNIRWLADTHLHPWDGEPVPSSTDVNQLIESRKMRPWTIIGLHSLTKLKFFGLDDNSNLVEMPYQVIPDGFDEKKLLSRINEITDNEILGRKKIAILGCGSLSIGMIQSLAGTGVRSLLLGDMDSFADVNIVRHLGGIQDIGRDKTEILKEYIESHNPLVAVRTINDDLLKNRYALKKIVGWADLIIASSGNPALNYQINIQCVNQKKPVVFGGIYDRAESAYVFYYDPAEGKACFDCIFGLTSASIDNNTIKRKYGLEDGELKEVQGLFSNILIPGSMMGNIAIKLLMGESPECNLAIYHDTLKVERKIVSQKECCATCDYENWLNLQEQKIGTTEPQTIGFMKKIGCKLRRLRK